MRLEGHEDTGGAHPLCLCDQWLQQRQVPAMDAIKGAHGGVGGSERAWCWEPETDCGHEEKTARGCRR